MLLWLGRYSLGTWLSPSKLSILTRGGGRRKEEGGSIEEREEEEMTVKEKMRRRTYSLIWVQRSWQDMRLRSHTQYKQDKHTDLQQG